jgi:serine phosphatase RsbU (regulator of sigma subunit)
MFITAKLVYLDTQRAEMISASAGHCPLLFCGVDPEKVAPPLAGFPLGIELKGSYPQAVNALPPGAAALLYTDGMSDARNAGGELLGEANLRRFLAESVAQTKDADSAKKLLLDRLAEFRAGAPLTDDQTLVLIRHIP